MVTLGIAGCIAGFSTIPSRGHIPDNPWAEFGLFSLVAALFLPFSLLLVHMTITQWWMGSNGNWRRDSQGMVPRILGSLAYLMVGVALGVLGLMPALIVLPDDGGDVWGAITVGISALILGGLMLAAISGGYSLAGWPGAVVGVVFGLGFALLVAGIVLSHGWFAGAGAGALVISTLGFWIARLFGTRRDM